MECPLCGYPKTHKHGTTSKGSQRYRCPHCQQTFSEMFDTLYYRRQIPPQRFMGSFNPCSLRGLPRIAGVAYNTCVSVVRAASQQAQLIHNGEVHAVDTEAINADELWYFVKKSKAQ